MAVRTRRAYDRWARWYDHLARLPVVRSWRARAAAALALGATDAVLDVGCGTGANLPHLRRRVGPDGRLVGLDASRGSLAVARRRSDAAVVRGDFRRPPVRGSFEGVIATFVAAMVPDPAAAVDAWCDCVPEGGRVALLHFDRSDRWWARLPNVAYRAFVRLSTPGTGGGPGGPLGDVESPAAVHHARVRAAHRALAARTEEYRERALAGGYVRLASGRL